MAETSGISWTDATFNPWWGCTRVSPGCERCYAEQLATVRRKLDVWGVDADRKPMSEAYWRDPLKWNRKAEAARARVRVFCASMADVFESPPARNLQANDVQRVARVRLWSLIESTPWLDWLLLTKRPENVASIAPWGASKSWPANVWLGCTAEDQKRADERVPILCGIPATIRFVSHEPAIEAVDFSRWLGKDAVSWVITGGESAQRDARPYDVAWARAIVEQCRAAGVFPFVKQLGSVARLNGERYDTVNRKGDVPAEWPDDIRVQTFPRDAETRLAS